jgi:hypothetical protein
MTYARYLYTVAYGGIPTGYEVDHIDGNRKNDTIENLQLLTKGQNIAKAKSDPRGVNKKESVELVCPHCKVSFVRRKSSTFLSPNKGKLTFCSRKCGYHYREYSDYSQDYLILPKKEIKDTLTYVPWEEVSMYWPNGELPTPKDRIPRICSCCGGTYYSRYDSQELCSIDCANKVSSEKQIKAKDPSGIPGTIRKVLSKEISWVEAGRIHGVSDNAIRKWARKLGIRGKAQIP